MTKITIISKQDCPECTRIKRLLKTFDFEFEESQMETLPTPKQFELRNIARANRQMSMPLVFVDEKFMKTMDFENSYLNKEGK